MDIQQQVEAYINMQPVPKRGDMEALHNLILQVLPSARLWFFDGTNNEGKIVTNPTIGYGFHTMKNASGKATEWFKIGLSANKTGISIYILGISDKTYLAQKFGKELGKASVTGYCIKFKRLKDINTKVLEAAIRYGFEGEDKKV